jgi:hypothetical protein
LQQLPNLTHELKSAQFKTTQVIVRFGLRLVVLVIFAAFGGVGFDRSLTALLWMSAILSAVQATVQGEEPLDVVLTHWDESMAYAALCFLAIGLDHAVPI